MPGDFYYCEMCDLAYAESDALCTSPNLFAKLCPIDLSIMSLIDESEIDPSIFDYLGERS